MDELRQHVEAKLLPLLEPPERPDSRLDDLSEDERSLLAERNEQLEGLMLENQLLRLGERYPTEVGVLQKMLESDSIEDYVAVLAEARRSVTPAREPEDEVSDVDRNNPYSTPRGAFAGQEVIHLPDGRVITRAEGVEMLRQASSLS